MFGEMTVTGVKFNEIDEIAGGAFLKTFAKNNSDLGISEIDGKFYLVKKGKSKLMNTDTIKDIVKNELVGKTMDEIQSNHKLILLIEELNLIDLVELKSKTEEDISLF